MSLPMFSLQTQPLADGGHYVRNFWRTGISSTFHCRPWGWQQGGLSGGNWGGTGPHSWACGSHPPRPPPCAAATHPRRDGYLSLRGALQKLPGGLPAWGKSLRSCRPATRFGEAPAPELSLTAGGSAGPAFTLEEPGHPAPRTPELRRMETPKQGGAAPRACLPRSCHAAVKEGDPQQSQTGGRRRTALRKAGPHTVHQWDAGRRVSGSRAGGGFLPCPPQGDRPPRPRWKPPAFPPRNPTLRRATAA